MAEDGAQTPPRGRRALRIGMAVVAVLGAIALMIRWRQADPWVPIPPEHAADSALVYCRKLAAATQSLGYLHLIVGWGGALGGALLALLGGIVGSPGIEGRPKTIRNVVHGGLGFLLVGVGVLVGSIGMHFIDRSDSATRASVAATRALATPDSTGSGIDSLGAFSACVYAKAEWLSGRADHPRLQEIRESMGAPEPGQRQQ